MFDLALYTPPRYEPADWYWRAGNGRLFSSARVALVENADPDFQAWLAGGRAPTPWPRDAQGQETAGALQEVLEPHGLFASLEAYAASVRYAHETGGIAVAGLPVATDRGSQALINGAFNLVSAKPETIVRFKAGGGFVSLDAAAVAIIATEVGEHVQRCFAREAEVVAAIAAGTIATKAEVDAAFADAA